jgi:hypothetical protein
MRALGFSRAQARWIIRLGRPKVLLLRGLRYRDDADRAIDALGWT